MTLPPADHPRVCRPRKLSIHGARRDGGRKIATSDSQAIGHDGTTCNADERRGACRSQDNPGRLECVRTLARTHVRGEVAHSPQHHWPQLTAPCLKLRCARTSLRSRMSAMLLDALANAREMPSTAIRAMIVEDEPLGRRLLRTLLGDIAGIEIVGEAGTAAAGRQALLEQRPDLLFLDIQMPGGSGLEILKGIESPPEVVFVTGHPEFALPAL